MNKFIDELIKNDLRLSDGTKIYKIPISSYRNPYITFCVICIMIAMLFVLGYYTLILKKAFDDSDEFYWNQAMRE